MTPSFANPSSASLPLHVVSPEGLDAWRATLDPATSAWIAATGF